MLWETYIGESVAHLPDICLVDQEIWLTISPLIFFETVEWHRPEQVLRQSAFIRAYLRLARQRKSYIWLTNEDATSTIKKHIMHHTLPYGLHV